MQKFKKILKITFFFAAIGISLCAMGGEAVFAQAQQQAQQGVNTTGDQGAGAVTGLVENIVNILSWIVGVASVIMIIIGGMRYITSSGDASGIQSAKNTIIYAIIGLVVAIFAQGIVQFVLSEV